MRKTFSCLYYSKAIAPDLNTVDPFIKSLVVKYRINVTLGDTVDSRMELSPDTTFAFPQVFYKRASDTTRSYIDTVTEAMGLAPAPARYYVRIWSVSRNGKDSAVSKLDVDTTLETVQQPKLQVTQVLPHSSGAYFTLNYFSGNSAEKMNVAYKYSYDSSNFFSAGTRQLIGVKNAHQDSVWGLFSNKPTWLWIQYQNSVGSGDTVIFFRTTLQPQKAVVTTRNITAKVNDIAITGDIATFNAANRLVAYWGSDSLEIFGSVKSLKAEPFTANITGLLPNTNYSGTLVAYSAYGKTTVTWSSKTLEAPVTPTVTITKVEPWFDGVKVTYTWQTNSDDPFIRDDAKVYQGSMPAAITQISSGSSNPSGTSTATIVLDPGTYEMYIVSETQKGNFVKSNTFTFTLGTAITPDLALNSVFIDSGKVAVDYSWILNSYDLLTNIRVNIYSDADQMTLVKSSLISSGVSTANGSAIGKIAVSPGTYWVTVSGQIAAGIMTSNVMQVIVCPTGILPLSMATESVECYMFDFMGRELGKVTYNGDLSQTIPAEYWNQIIILRSTDGRYGEKAKILLNN